MDPIPLAPGIELRELQREDADAVFALVDAERDRLAERLEFVHRTESAQDTRAFIEDCRASQEHLDGIGIWAEGSFAGVVGMRAGRYNSGEIGYWLGDAFEGRGIVTAACRAIIDIAFARGIHRVTIEVEPDNVRSRAIPERLGFTLEARLREAIKVGDRYGDVVIYSLLASEWPTAAG